MEVGILHPGAMGSAMAGCASGQVRWAGVGRSAATRARAEHHGLTDVGSVEALASGVDVLVAVCPPDAALQVADAVAGFEGIYVDANAISPDLSREIGSRFARFVDGGIIGPPPTEPGRTRLYLCGDDAAAVAAIWEGSALQPVLIDGPPGSASAVKTAYAGWTKGSAALLLAMRAYAETAGVGEELLAEWEQSIPELVARVPRTAAGVGPKAWRFAGEMEQIAAALHAAGLPAGFHEAAGEIYARMAGLRNADSPTLQEVIGLIRPGSVAD